MIMTTNYKVVKFATHDTEFSRRRPLGRSVNKDDPPETRKPRSVREARLFETSYRRSWTQARPFPLEEAAWLKAVKLEGYAPRRPPGPMALQEVLFPHLDAL